MDRRYHIMNTLLCLKFLFVYRCVFSDLATPTTRLPAWRRPRGTVALAPLTDSRSRTGRRHREARPKSRGRPRKMMGIFIIFGEYLSKTNWDIMKNYNYVFVYKETYLSVVIIDCVVKLITVFLSFFLSVNHHSPGRWTLVR